MKINNCKLIEFTQLTTNESNMVLKWRNSEKVRFWMYNSAIIPLSEHLNFINTLSNDKNKKYFLVQKDNINIGVIYFIKIDNTKKECEFGLYANPFEKIVGAGRILEEICIKYAFEALGLHKLKLEVFSENKKAIKLYKNYNFKEVDRKTIKGKEVICMELNNETI